MDRRNFLKSLMGLAGAAAAGVALAPQAQALPVAAPAGSGPQVGPQEAVATEQDIAEAKAQQAQYYYYRRPRRRYVRRYYRPRIVRRYYRPRYFVPRRVYRRRYWW